MKTAILHNYLDNIGGAERVDLTLARELKADLYSTVADQKAIAKQGFRIKVKKIGWIPINAPFRQQAALWRFRNLDLRGDYDNFIIGGDWAVSACVKNKPNLWYVHSPMREIWDLYKFTRKNNVHPIGRPIFDIWAKVNRRLIIGYAKHAGKIVANSENTRKRVKKYMGMDADVIHPPTDTKNFHYKKNGGYWLSVNRLINHKRVDMQARAFAKMPDEKLIIVGCYEKSAHFRRYADYLRKIKPDNVKMLHHASFKEIKELYANCRGFITTSKNEDFGMTPVEAMAAGKPVIAPNEGGYKETVIDGVTGKLIDNIDADKIAGAVKEIGKAPGSYKDECLKRAKQFDTKVFIKKIKEQISR